MKFILRSKRGGLIMVGVGFCWRVAEATHNWTYLTQWVSKATLHTFVAQFTHPPVAMLILGIAWVLLADRFVPRGGSKLTPPERDDIITQEIRAALNTDDDVLLHVDKHSDGHCLTLLKTQSGELDRHSER